MQLILTITYYTSGNKDPLDYMNKKIFSEKEKNDIKNFLSPFTVLDLTNTEVKLSVKNNLDLSELLRKIGKEFLDLDDDFSIDFNY